MKALYQELINAACCIWLMTWFGAWLFVAGPLWLPIAVFMDIGALAGSLVLIWACGPVVWMYFMKRGYSWP